MMYLFQCYGHSPLVPVNPIPDDPHFVAWPYTGLPFVLVACSHCSHSPLLFSLSRHNSLSSTIFFLLLFLFTWSPRPLNPPPLPPCRLLTLQKADVLTAEKGKNSRRIRSAVVLNTLKLINIVTRVGIMLCVFFFPRQPLPPSSPPLPTKYI